MAKAWKVEVDEGALRAFLAENKPVRDFLIGVGQQVASEAQATASDAENGAGGTIDGYAAAGFSVEWKRGVKRPEIHVNSNADGRIAEAAHFNSQRKNGVGHLRAALYKFTTRG